MTTPAESEPITVIGCDSPPANPVACDAGLSKAERVSLGLAILDTVLEPGDRWTLEDIADVAGCSRANIEQLEAKALKSLRRKLKKAGLSLADLQTESDKYSSIALPKPVSGAG